MSNKRESNANKNMVVSFGCQIITLLCGFIVPKLMLDAFGSEVYGATSSITQFLAYVTLLEGGIGGVARAVLYKPLAENDTETISAIMAEIRRFFWVIACIFAGYVLVLAGIFKSISNVQSLDWFSTFLLVIVISVSTFGQYFIGISNSILLQASQKSYITNLVNIIGTVLNTISIIVLVHMNCSIIIVKLVSSLIFFMKPVALWLYVRRRFRLISVPKTGKTYLTQKWSGLGQHIAYFLHSNTSVVVLTCFADLQSVSVYAVHNMVVSHIENLTTSFVSGMEALFGEMLAKKEYDELHKTFGSYETLISIVSVVLFSTTAILIVPFVQLYTEGLTDADYYAPLFAVLLVLSAALYCLRMPYHAIVIAAGHFRETKLAAYGEAVINIVLSVLLVSQFGLIGVTIGTIVATGFRFGYYVLYLSNHIFDRKLILFLKRAVVNSLTFAAVFFLGNLVISQIRITDYLLWAVCGVLVVIVSFVIVISVNLGFYRADCLALLRRFIGKKSKQ